jgi:hypothetical protein
LETFWTTPQGDAPEGRIGYRGWYYHFLEMDTAQRAWHCELSSIDTALFLAGAIDVGLFFDPPGSTHPASVQHLVDRLLDRVDWEWMRHGGGTLTMGWHPERGFIDSRWRGYNEAMILYLLALGAERNPLPPAAWTAWTDSYSWQTHFGQSYLEFPHLFVHQYSHCWVDFRGQSDAWMRARGGDYFENSRRATLAQQAYAISNPASHPGYGPWVWGFTACDGPDGYSARGAPPADHEDGTIAPTAVAGSLPFAPEICLPTLRNLYSQWGSNLWTAYGFRDALNVRSLWVADDVLGIDQGPILLMIENYRTGRVWSRLRQSPILQRGLKSAGFIASPPAISK